MRPHSGRNRGGGWPAAGSAPRRRHAGDLHGGVGGRQRMAADRLPPMDGPPHPTRMCRARLTRPSALPFASLFYHTRKHWEMCAPRPCFLSDFFFFANPA